MAKKRTKKTTGIKPVVPTKGSKPLAPAKTAGDQLFDELVQNPNDWKLRSILADWCEDNQRPDDALCLRWMITNKKRPYHGGVDTDAKATWFNANKISQGLGDTESDLPEPLFVHLSVGKVVANHISYDSVRAAEEAILAAWKKALELTDNASPNHFVP